LIGYFRSADKTSDVIGTRQAAVFRAFASLAGHHDESTAAPGKATTKGKDKGARTAKVTVAKPKPAAVELKARENMKVGGAAAREMALTVRIEINLPADGTRATYDNIFQSIRDNLLNE
jgi:hypothetical protein